MASAYELAVSLPPFLYDSSQKERIAPVVNATFSTDDYKATIGNRFHLTQLEQINRAAHSGRQDVLDNAVQAVQDDLDFYHKKNIARMPVRDSAPVLGMVPSMKNATMKHQAKSKE